MISKIKLLTITLVFVSLGHSSFANITPPKTEILLAEPFLVRVMLVTPKRPESGVPLPTRQTLPEYPLVQREARIQGEVIVGLTVEADGRITKLRIISSNEKAFEEATLEALKSWRYIPCTINRQYVTSNLEYSIRFELPE